MTVAPVTLTPARPNAAQPSDSKLGVGGRRTLGELYDQFGGIAYSLAYSITADRESAEHVVTLSFAAAWNEYARKRVAPQQFLFSLMSAVRANAVACKGTNRSEAAVARFDSSATGTNGGSVEHAVAHALQELPDTQRNVLALAYFGGLAVGEIAAELQAPMGYVKENLQAAMRHLRSVLTRRSSSVVSV
ncbi:MAG TPA: sigma factor-like helix-turn-helix DNA-binding protein [Gemmatimonadaceae bacterium]|nr:sigma factor-like helix-turn-helix DNA-binding protein [Gemmatimonadaceae bacterium]